jgi:hypothetical protein
MKKYPLKGVSSRVVAAIGFSKRTLERIKKEKNDTAIGAIVSSSMWGKSRPREKNIVIDVENF